MFEECFNPMDQEMTLDQSVNDILPGHAPVLTVWCLGRSVKPLREFLASVQAWAEQDTRERNVTKVKVPHLDEDWLGYWRHSKYVMSRPLDTVELDDQIKGPLVEDLGNFLSAATKR